MTAGKGGRQAGKANRQAGRSVPKPVVPDRLWHYRCPGCGYVGVVVTNKPYANCGMCRNRFGLRHNAVGKAEYERLYGGQG